MFGLGKSQQTPSTIGALQSLHASMLAGETIETLCHGFGADLPHPEPIGTKRPPQLSREDQLSASGAAHLRLAAVHQALGMHNSEFTELPFSRTGYTLARTQTRLLIFDGLGRSFMGESPVEGVWLQSIQHGDGMLTLVFKDGEERVAVSTRRQYELEARNFVLMFPDRRDAPRVLHVVGQPTIAFG